MVEMSSVADGKLEGTMLGQNRSNRVASIMIRESRHWYFYRQPTELVAWDKQAGSKTR